MPDGGLPKSAVIHGFFHRLPMMELADQLTLGFGERVVDVRVLSHRCQRLMARQSGAQCDPLLLAVAVLQGDIDNNITGVPPSQVRPKSRQHLDDMRPFSRHKAAADMNRILPKGFSLSVISCGHLNSPA